MPVLYCSLLDCNIGQTCAGSSVTADCLHDTWIFLHCIFPCGIIIATHAGPLTSIIHTDFLCISMRCRTAVLGTMSYAIWQGERKAYTRTTS